MRSSTAGAFGDRSTAATIAFGTRDPCGATDCSQRVSSTDQRIVIRFDAPALRCRRLRAAVVEQVVVLQVARRLNGTPGFSSHG
jgi:hypothetical protein